MIPNVKIAVVDSHKLIRDLAVDVLAFSVNRKVFSFDEGFELWDYLRSNDSADLIVIDNELPDISGIDLLFKIKKTFPKKICILMSSDIAKEQKALECKADAFLAKPFTVNDLFDIVQKFVVEIDWKPFQK
ncbi:MAG: response regulator [Desulfobacterales bacterium]|nr:response regulator [Desulfobacterales bacterium]